MLSDEAILALSSQVATFATTEVRSHIHLYVHFD